MKQNLDDEVWTSVLPSTMESDPEGLELPVHDLRALGAVPATGMTPTPLQALPSQSVAAKSMPSVGAIVELPARPVKSKVDLERKILIAVAIASLIAILVSLVAIFSAGDRDSNANEPETSERR
jgi:hypothetical protein